jgi:hypothetical protein
VSTLPGDSTAERWASLGTGVRTEAHGVRAIEGVRFRRATHLLQRISRADFVLKRVAPALRIARREPLPPTVRRRDYIWEIVAARGLPAVSVNWWATANAHSGAPFDRAGIGVRRGERRRPAQSTRPPARASSPFSTSSCASRPSTFPRSTSLNRLDLDRRRSSRNAARTGRAHAHDRCARARLRRRPAGMPGDGQSGHAVVASTLPLQRATSAFDVAPTLLEMLGFPLSNEMPGCFAAVGAKRAAHPELWQSHLLRPRRR